MDSDMAVPQLDQFVLTVRNLANSGDNRELTEYLSKQSETLHKYVSNLDSVLEALDVHENSITVLTVLGVKATAQKPPDIPGVQYHTAIATQINDFVITISEDELRVLAEPLANVMKSMLTNLGDMEKPMSAIPIIRRAICKLQEKPYQLTQLHCLLCQACLMSNNLKPALSLLDQDIYVLGTDEPGVTFDPKFFLSYYYLGGVIYTAMKNYSRAITFFEIALTTLLPLLSQVMVESYKKFVLVSIIHLGTVPTLPKLSPALIERVLKPVCQAYLDIIPAYQSGDPEELQRTISKYHDVYIRDNNKGLVKQVVKALHRKNIHKLTNTFLNMSISDLAQRINLPNIVEAEEHLMSMIESGEIYGKINRKEGTIMFNDPPKKYEDPSVLKKILDEVTNKISFSSTVQMMDEAILINPAFVKKTSSEDDGLSLGQSSSKSYQA
ncbi:COP9 signalosome complex subunit 3 [Rhopalosiphum maidis]|uniref:COP9 signalosome complex subunit 3 n=1 Tax=Rhopalosiphum maidis TaxID=43146 RepID=UPI000EFFDE7F|nr:COP9 signalosome complex subunit 3 [Rhopalosiphum maidis]